MALQVLRRDQPSRAIALVSDTHALIFRPSHVGIVRNGPSTALPPQSMVEFAPVESLDLSGYRPARYSKAVGTLGLINIGTDIFICTITSAFEAANVRPGERVLRIGTVGFYCINRAEFDDFPFEDLGRGSNDAFNDYAEQLESREQAAEHPCFALKKLLGDGTFYYSVDFDLTSRLQNRDLEVSTSKFDIDNFDDAFLWNSYMIKPLIRFRSQLSPLEKQALDSSHILTSAIRGFVSTITVPAANSPLRTPRTRLPSTISLISRLSCRRAGTRFNSRGIDDDGNVSNFVETETVFWFPSGLCFSYCQVRGSVPLFWEQQATGLLPQQQKIQITRSSEATQPAFNKHFEDLELKYGSVHVFNMLSETKSGEVELTSRYNFHLQLYSQEQNSNFENHPLHTLLQQSQYDFHAETREKGYEAARAIRFIIQEQAEAFAYFLADEVQNTPSGSLGTNPSPVAILEQSGVFRTNCLDCLDRTNLIQTFISQMMLEMFFAHRGDGALADFWMRHSALWADNGDALSKIYAGTGALKSSFTRHGKMSLAGALADARKSATRLYMTNFADKGRQATIDTLLGRRVDQLPVNIWDPINDFVSRELYKRSHEFSKTESIAIWTGTFNLNGRGRGTEEDLSTWIFPERRDIGDLPDIFVIGFQEIVELSPQQIMSTDPARRLQWEFAVAKTLNRRAEEENAEQYVLLRSGQLVGAALIVFVKSSVLSSIKNVEGSAKKTGMNGMAGNKGGVAIRIDFASTRICFVTAHLAAGFANYDERNRDYQTIAHGLRFQRNRSIDDHDAIIWLGDFNYRVGLNDEKTRKLIGAGDFATLYHNDQLNIQMVAGHTFPYYSEAKIQFPPTYKASGLMRATENANITKYNNGTDEYDTSEKVRIPAYCDRIVSKGDNLRQTSYGAAPLRFSDHRPVYATFQCAVKVEDEFKKDTLSKGIYESRKREILKATTTDLISEDLGNPPLELGSVKSVTTGTYAEPRKWWLDYNLGAKSNVAKLHQGYAPNPRRPPNPFSSSSDPDWVPVPKASDLNGSQPKAENSRLYTPADRSFARNTSQTTVASPPDSTNGQRMPTPPVPRKPITTPNPPGQAPIIGLTRSKLASADCSSLERHGTTQTLSQTGANLDESQFTLMDENSRAIHSIPALEPMKLEKKW